VSLYDSTFSRTVWRLYGGAKGLVVWYYQAGRAQKSLEGQDRFERWGMHYLRRRGYAITRTTHTAALIVRGTGYSTNGVHYLRSLLRAHQLRTCTNFMDPGLQVRTATATAITRTSACASL
jgi:hypothetical protein